MKKKILIILFTTLFIFGCSKSKESTNKFKVTDKLNKEVSLKYENGYKIASLINGQGYNLDEGNYLILDNIKYYEVVDEKINSFKILNELIKETFNDGLAKKYKSKINTTNSIMEASNHLYINVKSKCQIKKDDKVNLLSFNSKSYLVQIGDMQIALDKDMHFISDIYACN
jgi:hypothetical protein